MSTKFTTDELYWQLQSKVITWLDFMYQSEYAEEFREWCMENDLQESEDTAFLFSEKKDFETTMSPQSEF